MVRARTLFKISTLSCVLFHASVWASTQTSFSGFADSPATQSSPSEPFHEKINKERDLLLQSEIKKRGVLGTLYEINKDISKIDVDIRSVTEQVNKAQKSISSYTKVISRLEDMTSSERKLLKARLRATYKMGFKGYAETLFSSHSADELSRNLRFLKIISDKDQKLISNYSENLTSLQRQQAKMRDQVKLYIQFQRTLEVERKQYAIRKQRQVHLLRQIDRDRNIHLQALHEWREAGRKFEEKLVKLGVQSSVSSDFSHGSFMEQRGILKPPVLRPILQGYGIIKNDRFNTQIFHKGLFFSAEPGDPVSSVFWGRVVFAGWINGYGQTIIVDHGDHYYSVYAHNSKLGKKSGDAVGTGEVIAEAGDTGSLRGPGLYLEIRHFSESLDPLPWLDLSKTTRL